VVISTLQANDYSVLPVTADFVQGGSWDTSRLVDIPVSVSDEIISQAATMRDKLTTKVATTNTSAAECLSSHNKQFISGYGDVFLVQQDNAIWHYPEQWAPKWFNDSAYIWSPPANASHYKVLDISNISTNSRGTPKYLNITFNINDILPFQSTSNNFPSYGWLCPSRSVYNCSVSTPGEKASSASTWAPYGETIDYCTSKHYIDLAIRSLRLMFRSKGHANAIS
jgi:hypothetical protein